MSLTARERHTLHTIEAGLACSDPALASLAARFTRLASGEAMPARERIPPCWPRALRRPRRHRRGLRRDGIFHRAGGACRRLGGRPAMLLLCLIAATAEGIAVMLAVGLNRPEGPPASPPPCNAVLTRLSPAARSCIDVNATDGALGVQPAMGSRLWDAAIPVTSSSETALLQ